MLKWKCPSFVLFILFPLFSLFAEAPRAEIITGKLENGLTYCIHPCHQEKKELSVRLAVKCGSVYETEEELGLAHFLEHMVFHGSPHFKEDGIRKYLKSIGMDIGPDVNAYTGFESTVYSFDIPSRQRKKLEEALLILSDFAGRTEFCEPLVEKEKVVILDEMHRYDVDPLGKLMKKQLNFAFEKTVYQDRFPIGKEDVIRGVTAKKLENFYKKWYRPDRMALIIVGDVDPTETFSLLESCFANLQAPQEIVQTPFFAMPFQSRKQPLIHFDKELTFTSITLTQFLLEDADDQESLRRDLISMLLASRISDLEKKYPDLFIGSWCEGYEQTNFHQGLQVGAFIFEEKMEEALYFLNQELEKVRTQGFLRSEFDEAVSNWQGALNVLIEEEEKIDFAECAAGYVDDFVAGDDFILASEAYLKGREILSQMTKEALNEKSFMEKFKQESLLAFATPSSAAYHRMHPSKLLAFFEFFNFKEKEKKWRFDDPVLSLALLSKDQDGFFVSKEELSEAGERWTLANGVHVTLVPSTSFGKKICLFGIGPGGLSAFAQNLYPSASLACDYFIEREFAGLSVKEWTSFLKHHDLDFSISAGLNDRYLSLICPKEESLALFQTLFVFFTQNLSEKGDVWEKFLHRKQAIEQMERKGADNQFNFFVQRTNTQDHYLFQPVDFSLAQEKEALVAFKKLFGSPKAFEWVIVGDFTLNDMKSQVAYWMGNLPAGAPDLLELPKELPYFPKGRQELQIPLKGGLQNQSVLTLPFDYGASLEKARYGVILKAALTLIQDRFEEALRWDKGKTYGTYFSYDTPFYPSFEGASLSVTFTAEPEHLQEMKRALFQEIKRLKSELLTDQEVFELKTKIENRLEGREESGSFLVQELFNNLWAGRSPFYVRDFYKQLESLSAETIQEVMQEVFKSEDYTFISQVYGD